MNWQLRDDIVEKGAQKRDFSQYSARDVSLPFYESIGNGLYANVIDLSRVTLTVLTGVPLIRSALASLSVGLPRRARLAIETDSSIISVALSVSVSWSPCIICLVRPLGSVPRLIWRPILVLPRCRVILWMISLDFIVGPGLIVGRTMLLVSTLMIIRLSIVPGPVWLKSLVGLTLRGGQIVIIRHPVISASSASPTSSAPSSIVTTICRCIAYHLFRLLLRFLILGLIELPLGCLICPAFIIAVIFAARFARSDCWPYAGYGVYC